MKFCIMIVERHGELADRDDIEFMKKHKNISIILKVTHELLFVMGGAQALVPY